MFFKILFILVAIFSLKAFSADEMNGINKEKLRQKQLEIIKTSIKINSDSK